MSILLRLLHTSYEQLRIDEAITYEAAVSRRQVALVRTP